MLGFTAEALSQPYFTGHDEHTSNREHPAVSLKPEALNMRFFARVGV